jgi:hypothetical protein
MATPLTPPPGLNDSSSGAPPATPSAPMAASPSPPQPSPQMQQGTQDVIEVVQKLRGIAKAYPSAAPTVAKINDLMREMLAAMLQHQTPGEPAAPPMNG